MLCSTGSLVLLDVLLATPCFSFFRYFCCLFASFFHLFVHLFVHPFVHPFAHLFAHPFAHFFTYPFVHSFFLAFALFVSWHAQKKPLIFGIHRIVYSIAHCPKPFVSIVIKQDQGFKSIAIRVPSEKHALQLNNDIGASFQAAYRNSKLNKQEVRFPLAFMHVLQWQISTIHVNTSPTCMHPPPLFFPASFSLFSLLLTWPFVWLFWVVGSLGSRLFHSCLCLCLPSAVGVCVGVCVYVCVCVCVGMLCRLRPVLFCVLLSSGSAPP